MSETKIVDIVDEVRRLVEPAPCGFLNETPEQAIERRRYAETRADEMAREWIKGIVREAIDESGVTVDQSHLVATEDVCLPCSQCRSPVVKEFVVPNDVWNVVVRQGGKETGKEYLCEECFRLRIVEHVRELSEGNEYLRDVAAAADRELCDCAHTKASGSVCGWCKRTRDTELRKHRNNQVTALQARISTLERELADYRTRYGELGREGA